LSAAHVVADVTVEDEVHRAVDMTVAFAGNLKGVVANAGGGGGIGPYHLQDRDEYLRVLELNILGTMLCVKHSVPSFVRAGVGSFVGMSSIAGSTTHLVFGAYPISKAAIDHMMRNAADEYGPANIRFNSVRPGFTTTEIMEGVPREGEVFVSFLVGPDSSRVTGQAIAIDGGHHLRAGPDFRSFTGLTPDQLVARDT
jgi:NAD(P)-dependent dehydrogenase (short-subunit alcohol dehydrogenase family)